jgi:hypothetical protein
MAVLSVGRGLGALAVVAIVGTALSGCVFIPPPIFPLHRAATAQVPSEPDAPSPLPDVPTILAANPISVTMTNGVPVVQLCEDATVNLMDLSESLITNDPSQGYVDVWLAQGQAVVRNGDQIVVGTAPRGLSSSVKGKPALDYGSDSWELELDDLTHPSEAAIVQTFRGADLAEGQWLDATGRRASGPCVSGAG